MRRLSMIRGMKRPAGGWSLGGHVHRLMQHVIVTELGSARICDVALLALAVAASWALCSGVLHLGYLLAKGLI